jgi:poly-beta-hydroxyalkanoate depolymerase
MKKHELISDIAETISEYVEQKLKKHINDDKEWESYYNNCILELKQDLKTAESVIKNYTEENLTVNRIEQEGYLRALKTMLNSFEKYKPDAD